MIIYHQDLIMAESVDQNSIAREEYLTFTPTQEQRMIVKICKGCGAKIDYIRRYIINPQTQRPICKQTFVTAFAEEIQIGKSSVMVKAVSRLFELMDHENGFVALDAVQKTINLGLKGVFVSKAKISRHGSVKDNAYAILEAVNSGVIHPRQAEVMNNLLSTVKDAEADKDSKTFNFTIDSITHQKMQDTINEQEIAETAKIAQDNNDRPATQADTAAT